MKLQYILTILLVFVFATTCVARVKTSAGPEIQVSGAEQWVINSAKYHIDGTMLVQVTPRPYWLYAVRVIIDDNPGPQQKPLAKLIAKYAIAHGYFARAKHTHYNGKSTLLVPRNGVAVIRKMKSVFFSEFKGYRFQFNLEDLK